MLVLLTLAAGQLLMTLDSSVMNVSIATVAEDVGTTVTRDPGRASTACGRRWRSWPCWLSVHSSLRNASRRPNPAA